MILSADCGIPKNLPNSQWIPGPTLAGNLTSYKCDVNTVLEGDVTITCGPDGTWSKAKFYCRRKFIRYWSSLNHGIADVIVTTFYYKFIILNICDEINIKTLCNEHDDCLCISKTIINVQCPHELFSGL